MEASWSGIRWFYLPTIWEHGEANERLRMLGSISSAHRSGSLLCACYLEHCRAHRRCSLNTCFERKRGEEEMGVEGKREREEIIGFNPWNPRNPFQPFLPACSQLRHPASSSSFRIPGLQFRGWVGSGGNIN